MAEREALERGVEARDFDFGEILPAASATSTPSATLSNQPKVGNAVKPEVAKPSLPTTQELQTAIESKNGKQMESAIFQIFGKTPTAGLIKLYDTLVTNSLTKEQITLLQSSECTKLVNVLQDHYREP